MESVEEVVLEREEGDTRKVGGGGSKGGAEGGGGPSARPFVAALGIRVDPHKIERPYGPEF